MGFAMNSKLILLTRSKVIATLAKWQCLCHVFQASPVLERCLWN